MNRPVQAFALVPVLCAFLVVGMGCHKKDGQSQAGQVTSKSSTSDDPAPGQVEGGAWYRTVGGSSAILRGLKVLLLQRRVTTKDARPSLETRKKSADGLVEILSGKDNDVVYEPGTEAKRQELIQKAKDTSAQLAAMARKSDGTEIDQLEFYVALRQVDKLLAHDEIITKQVELKSIKRLTRQSMILKDGLQELVFVSAINVDTTNIEGKYKLTSVPEGRYYLCAFDLGEKQLIEWIVPVQVSRGKATALDLSTDNASLVLVSP